MDDMREQLGAEAPYQESPGNSAWQRAQRLALEQQAQERRN